MKKSIAIALAALLALATCAPEAGKTPTTPSESVPASTAPESAPPAPERTPPVPENTPPAEETPAGAEGGGVYTDWSGLEPYEPPELIFRRWYEEPVRELRPLGGGYGVLVPYVGSAPPDLNWGGVYEYGLMTMDGTIVVDTAYSDVYRLSLRGSGELTRLPVLALMTTELVENEEYGYTYGEQRFGAAALDGSWALPPEYNGIRAYSPEGFFLWDEDTVYVYRTDGQLCRSISCAGVSFPDEFMDMTGLDGSVVSQLEGTTLRLLDLETGESVYVEGISDMIFPGDGLFPVQLSDSGLWGCVDRTGAWVIPARYQDCIYPFGDGSGVVWVYEDGAERFVDREGNEYSQDPRPPQAQTPQEDLDRWVSRMEDPYTGETWYLRSLYAEDRPGYLIEDRDGNVLGNVTIYGSRCKVVNGLFLNIDGETAGYKDREGNWVFRIRLAEAGD